MRGITWLVSRGAVRALIAGLAILAMQVQAGTETGVSYVRPGVDFAKYTQFIVTPINLSDTKLVPPPWVDNAEPGLWTLTDEDKAFIGSLYMESIAKGIMQSKQFSTVGSPSAETIQVNVRITRLTPWMPKGEAGAETQGSGELAFEAELRDSITGDLLAIVEGTQQVGKNYQQNTRLNHEHNLRTHFESWGAALSAALAKRHQQ